MSSARRSLGGQRPRSGLAFLALRHPIAALTVSLLSVTVILVSATWLVKTVRRRFAKARAET